MVFDSRLQLCDPWKTTYIIITVIQEKARTLLNYFVKGPRAVEVE